MKKSPGNPGKLDKPDERFASTSDVDELKRMHATFVGLDQLFDTVRSKSPERIEALGKNPFFDRIRRLVKKVPRLNTEKQFQSFAVELDKAAGAWPGLRPAWAEPSARQGVDGRLCAGPRGVVGPGCSAGR